MIDPDTIAIERPEAHSRVIVVRDGDIYKVKLTWAIEYLRDNNKPNNLLRITLCETSSYEEAMAVRWALRARLRITRKLLGLSLTVRV